MQSITLNNMTFDEYVSAERIQQLVSEVAERINHDYEGREPLFVCVLNGAFVYAADLFRKIKLHSDITFVRLRSYEGTSTTGKVEMVVPLQQSVKDRDVIIVEDIVDTGLTMHCFRQLLQEQGARSITVTSFLFKPEALKFPEEQPEYPALAIPKKFVIGYGLDLYGFVRNLDAIYTLRDNKENSLAEE